MKKLIMACVFAVLAAAQTKLNPVDEAAYAKLVASHKGKVLVIDFWATWCKPCREQMPKLVQLEEKLRAKGVDVVTISADEPEAEAEARKVLNENHVPGPVFIRHAKDDDKFIDAIDAKWTGALPAIFIYDRTGKKVRSFIGETPMPDIEAVLAKLTPQG